MLKKIESITITSNGGNAEDLSPMAAENTESDLKYGPVLRFHGWEVPNTYVMYQTYKLHKQLKESYPQYGMIDGTDNIWICKPSYTARGVGIFCFRNLREVFTTGHAKKQMCPRIVQKYVERSFLLNQKFLPQLPQNNTSSRFMSDMRRSKSLS